MKETMSERRYNRVTEKQVRLLRKLHQEGKGGAELHKLYGRAWGISQQSVYAILTYRTWKHLEDEVA